MSFISQLFYNMPVWFFWLHKNQNQAWTILNQTGTRKVKKEKQTTTVTFPN